MTVSVGSGGTRTTPLRGLDLEVGTGEVVAVRGPSGSGKSTLLGVLSGDLEPDSGQVTVGGASPPEARRDPGVGFVYQDFRLVEFLTALENVAMALEILGHRSTEAVERSRAELSLLGVEDIADRLPGEMSGGQQQRVAIARTVACEPALILADEPTAALDRTTAGHVVDTFLEAARRHGSAVVLATHDPLVSAVAETVLDLQDGHLVNDLVAMHGSGR
ncbi:MAG: ABC transporter ATP-binding protein [Brevibacterium aurantiacum]|nr:ABC transporter ATP-binding protein [Isoptericola jiangsuensis]